MSASGSIMDLAERNVAYSKRIIGKNAKSQDWARQLAGMIAKRGLILQIGTLRGGRSIVVREPMAFVRTLNQAMVQNPRLGGFLRAMVCSNKRGKSEPVVIYWKQWQFLKSQVVDA